MIINSAQKSLSHITKTEKPRSTVLATMEERLLEQSCRVPKNWEKSTGYKKGRCGNSPCMMTNQETKSQVEVSSS